MNMEEFAIQGCGGMLKNYAEGEEASLKLKPRYKYMNDPEEMAYWATVFGESKKAVEPENMGLPF